MHGTRKIPETIAVAARQAGGSVVLRPIVEAGLYASLALLVLVLILIAGRA